ncbi:uncharacterized protein LOC131643143 [Vicia villosa]|uniref:uncharacterized protein LOC131643143 n=1 Tax=Vicia villosa TaxID=3911 RepID=UPI00273B852C|nr:uncharacterized protein LOC131643143 [Vicia villosa]
MEEDKESPIILGRSFMKIARMMIDIDDGIMKLRVQDEEVCFNLFDAMKQPKDKNDCFRMDVTEESVVEVANQIHPSSPLERSLVESFNELEKGGNTITKEDKVEDLELKKGVKESKIELKLLPPHLKYVFLDEEGNKPVVISSKLTTKEEARLIQVLQKNKAAIGWVLADLKLHVVPKKGGMTVIRNDKNELIPTRTVTGWRMCIDYRRLNKATRKDHFPLPFMDQMLERLSGQNYYCFLDGRMPFGLCNAPATFQRCMQAIFSDLIEESIEVFMDDFSVFGKTFDMCLNNLDVALGRCIETNLILNWEKCHFMILRLRSKDEGTRKRRSSEERGITKNWAKASGEPRQS